MQKVVVVESEENRNNSSLFDNNTAQSMTCEQILAMKNSGTSGGEIVQML